MPPVRKTSTRDVDLATVKSKGEVLRVAAIGAATILTVLACAVPLLVVAEIVEPLAGKTTIVEAKAIFTFSVTVSIVINGLQYFKGRAQRRELKRLRRRVRHLEDRLDQGR